MYVTTRETDTERTLAVEEILEDIAGGGVIEKDDIPTSSSGVKEGTLVGVDTNGIYHIVKTAMVAHAASTNANALVVYANHEFVVGDYIGSSASGVASGALITAISASGAGYGIITCTWAGPNIAASGILVQASGLGHSNFKYVPEGILTNYVEKDKENTGGGIMVRGRVREHLMPYYIDSTLKSKLPLIRFV
jgi:hypothetical protein